jgi:hypothetical protein
MIPSPPTLHNFSKKTPAAYEEDASNSFYFAIMRILSVAACE